MNEYEYEQKNGIPPRTSQLDGIVRENPTRAILCGLGAGLVVALLVRALQPRTPQTRAARFLDDLRESWSDIAQPAYRRASSLANNGASRVHNGAAQLSHLHLDRRLQDATSRLRNLFR